MTKYVPQFTPLIKEAFAQKVKEQILSGWLGPSITTADFENRICEITGSKHCIATTSGTVAILLALGSLDLKPGSTILFPAYTFLAGANAARYLGYKIKLVDIKRETLSMNPDLVDLTGIDAVMFVNHNGYVGEDVKKIRDMCQEWCIPMIEDSSQGLGIVNAGRTGDLGIFSFSVPKLVTTGQGGAIITNSEILYSRCKEIMDHGGDWRKTRTHTKLGVNFKFNDILASYGLAQLNSIESLLSMRKTVFDEYRKYISLIDFDYDSTWMVIYQSKNPNKVMTALREKNISFARYYQTINKNPPYADNQNYPEANYISENCLYLPSSLTLDKSTIKRICRIIKQSD